MIAYRLKSKFWYNKFIVKKERIRNYYKKLKPFIQPKRALFPTKRNKDKDTN